MMGAGGALRYAERELQGAAEVSRNGGEAVKTALERMVSLDASARPGLAEAVQELVRSIREEVRQKGLCPAGACVSVTKRTHAERDRRCGRRA